jgi:hypothetical protein
MLPPLAHGQSQGGLDIETPGGGGSKPVVGKNKFDHQYHVVASSITPSMIKKSPHELDIGSTFKQPENKHCNLDQGQIENK